MRSMVSYQIMFHLGLTDCFQLICHACCGIFSFFLNSISEMFNKVFGAFISGAWWSMGLFIMLLALNRFVEIVYPAYTAQIFSPMATRIYIGLTWLIFVATTIFFITDNVTYMYYPEEYTWEYWSEAPMNDFIEALEYYLTWGEIIISAVCYTIIIFYIKAKYAKFGMTGGKSKQMLLTLQVAIICGYMAVVNLYWQFVEPLFEDTATKYYWLFSNCLWLFWCAMNPFVYIAFNKQLRDKVLIGLKLKESKMSGSQIPGTVMSKMGSRVPSRAGSRVPSRAPSPAFRKVTIQSPANEMAPESILKKEKVPSSASQSSATLKKETEQVTVENLENL